jgi:hypothetical protein
VTGVARADVPPPDEARSRRGRVAPPEQAVVRASTETVEGRRPAVVVVEIDRCVRPVRRGPMKDGRMTDARRPRGGRAGRAARPVRVAQRQQVVLQGTVAATARVGRLLRDALRARIVRTAAIAGRSQVVLVDLGAAPSAPGRPPGVARTPIAHSQAVAGVPMGPRRAARAPHLPARTGAVRRRAVGPAAVRPTSCCFVRSPEQRRRQPCAPGRGRQARVGVRPATRSPAPDGARAAA